VERELTERAWDGSDWTLCLPCPVEDFHPTERRLITTLQARGARVELLPVAADEANNLSTVRRLVFGGETVGGKESGAQEKVTLQRDDESLLIYDFPDERTAQEYLAAQPMEDVDVWINGDNRQMDSYLTLMNRPRTGSEARQCAPQLTQLFVTGLGLFLSPLNVNTLIEWLNMPLHPINGSARRALMRTIVKEGGYRNEACREIINQYIAGAYEFLTEEQRALPEAEQEQVRRDKKRVAARTKKVALFLPPMKAPQGDASEVVSVQALEDFAKGLGDWASRRAFLLRDTQPQQAEQLHYVEQMLKSFDILLGTVQGDTVDLKTVDTWVSTIYTLADFSLTTAERGCRTVVTGPEKLIAVADRTVWMGVEGDAGRHAECDFLYPSEREKFRKCRSVQWWDEAKATAYAERCALLPLLRTQKQLILVTCLRRQGEATQKHPLRVRLETLVSNLKEVTRTPQVSAQDFEMEPVSFFRREPKPAELQIDKALAGQLQWPSHLSPTYVEKLVEHPMDYVMEDLLGIKSAGIAAMSPVRTTLGNVAHAVIAELFAPRDEEKATPEVIAGRVQQEFEATYRQMLEQTGAILLLAENRLEEKRLHEELRHCVEALVQILKENRLSVTGCEQTSQVQWGLDLPKPREGEQEGDLLGKIDMRLATETGQPVVFDLKWTVHSKYLRDKLTENRSVQLELYSYIVSREQEVQSVPVAYYLMPEAKLVSTYAFRGNDCEQVTAANSANLVPLLKNAVEYRRRQIAEGIIETEGALGEMSYEQETAAKRLFPLKEDSYNKGSKVANPFSQFGFIK
jgi:hypothetical protein